MKLTDTQRKALRHLDGCVGNVATLSQFRKPTVDALATMGLVERFIPEATTYAAAARGRVPYYRLTAEGRKAVGRRKWDSVETRNPLPNEETEDEGDE